MPRILASAAGRKEFRILGLTFPLHRFQDGRFVSWYYHGSERKRVTRKSEADLRAHLEEAAVRILNGHMDVNELEGVEARAMIAARDAIAHLRLPIDVVAREYAAARALLGPIDLLEAVRFYKRHAGQRLQDKSVAAVITDFLTQKAGLSDQYRDQLRKDLGRFSASFGPRMIAEVSSAEISAWLAASGRIARKGPRKGQAIMPGAARLNQLRNTVATLFGFARNNQSLMRGQPTEAELVPKAKHVRGEIEILAPEDLRLILELTAQLDRRWLPYIVLAAFAGIRAVTLQRLDWRTIRWGQPCLQVPAAKSKISRRYLPPFMPAAAAWLEEWQGSAGPVAPATNPRYFLNRLARRIGWKKWPKNALRKSFISYRMAAVKSAAQVAIEANTSEAEIAENYREVCTPGGALVTEELAAKYFGTLPAPRNNIVGIQSHLAL